MECLPIGIAVVLIAVAFFYSAQQKEEHRRAMGVLASRNELMFDGESCTGSVGTASVNVDVYTTGGGKKRRTWTRFQVTDPNALHTDNIGAEGLLSGMGKMLSGNDVQLGDPVADPVLKLWGPADHILACVDAEGRVMLRRAVTGGWSHKDGTWVFRRTGRMTNVEEMDRIVRQGLALVQGTQRDDTVENMLVRRALTDPLETAAMRCLEERLRARTAIPDAQQQRLLQIGGVVSVLMASKMGVDGVPTLKSALNTGNRMVRIEAALALAAVGEGGATVEATLAQAVKTTVVERAIQALGKVGTVDSVPVLQPLADEWLGSNKGAALQAIRAIQARVVGAEAGQVSIVTASTGDVSIAEEARARPPKRQTEG